MKVTLLLLIIAFFLAGLIGYRFGSHNATSRYLEMSEVAIAVTVTNMIKTYEACGCPPSDEWCSGELVKARWDYDFFHTMHILDEAGHEVDWDEED